MQGHRHEVKLNHQRPFKRIPTKAKKEISLFILPQNYQEFINYFILKPVKRTNVTLMHWELFFFFFPFYFKRWYEFSFGTLFPCGDSDLNSQEWTLHSNASLCLQVYTFSVGKKKAFIESLSELFKIFLKQKTVHNFPHH